MRPPYLDPVLRVVVSSTHAGVEREAECFEHAH